MKCEHLLSFPGKKHQTELFVKSEPPFPCGKENTNLYYNWLCVVLFGVVVMSEQALPDMPLTCIVIGIIRKIIIVAQ